MIEEKDYLKEPIVFDQFILNEVILYISSMKFVIPLYRIQNKTVSIHKLIKKITYHLLSSSGSIVLLFTIKISKLLSSAITNNHLIVSLGNVIKSMKQNIEESDNTDTPILTPTPLTIGIIIIIIEKPIEENEKKNVYYIIFIEKKLEYI